MFGKRMTQYQAGTRILCPSSAHGLQNGIYKDWGGRHAVVVGSRMYDDEGTEYLDTRNNVCHIGHAHPAVAEAVATQVAALNTNSRYLPHHLCELSERLLATFPPELCVCFFVNSGSEANDLALRLARTHTKCKVFPSFL